ncbi:MAG: MGMT family protein [Candidatus Coproplasma sp.]
MDNFFSAVYEVVKSIPEGKVLSYGDVAGLVGAPRCARQVGWALHNNPQPGVIPCHRVVFRDGSVTQGFAFGGEDAQIALLRGEGVEVNDGKVDMNKYRWII